jgi:hypothetical protein
MEMGQKGTDDHYRFLRPIMTETLILNEPFESWPECDALLSFSSTGFPLEKGGFHDQANYLIN